jgi:EmrB/QacA subfamily drug resistance transporter
MTRRVPALTDERPDPTGEAGSAGHRIDRRLVGLGLIIVSGAFMSAMDATTVSVALDRIGNDLAAPLSALQWVSIAYLLALAAVVPVTAWSVERFGARRMWIFALGMFTVASILCGLAWTIGSLITFRVLQGLGGGLIPPLAQVILVRAAGPARIGRVMGMVSVPTQLAPIVGPTVGGFLVSSVDWRWIFFLNLPLGAVAMTLALRGLPADERLSAPRLDLVGVLLLSPAVTAVVYGLTTAGAVGGARTVPVAVALTLGSALLIAFFLHARRGHQSPALDLRLFRHRPFAVASGMIFLAGASLFGLMFLLPLYQQQARGVDALRVGLLLAPQGAGMVLALTVVGSLVDRYGPRRTALVGIVLTTVGTLPFTNPAMAGDDTITTVALAIRGLGLGAATIPLTAAAYHGLAGGSVPRAASALVIGQRIGGSLGTAVLALILQGEIRRASGGEAPPAPEALGLAYGRTFWWTVAFGALALVPALLLPTRAAMAGAGPSTRPADGD